jgi:hypothetical protein
MRSFRTSCAIVGLAAVAGCSRQEPLPCEPEARYSTARSSLPVQIPDDLSPPNETDAIRLPPDPSPVASITAGDCTEAPPPFFGDSRPFVSSGDAEEPRQSRRERRKQERAEAPAAQPEAPPAEPRDPAPTGDDRVIDN